MNVEQLLLQLGLGGALVWAFVKIFTLAIDRWSASEAAKLKVHTEAESKRTEAIAIGFATLGGKVDAHTSADLASHQALATGIAEIKGRLDGAPIQQQPARDTGPVRLLRAGTNSDER
jgi:hypothetical protein